MEDLILRRGDTRPALEVTCTDNGTPVDLSPADLVTVVCKPSVDGAPVIRRVAQSHTAEGVVTMPWADPDTNLVCSMRVEVEVMWPDGSKQTFPAGNKVQVYPDLG